MPKADLTPEAHPSFGVTPLAEISNQNPMTKIPNLKQTGRHPKVSFARLPDGQGIQKEKINKKDLSFFSWFFISGFLLQFTPYGVYPVL